MIQGDLTRDLLGKLLRSALQLEHPYVDRGQKTLSEKISSTVISSAVLIVFAFPKAEANQGPSILFTRRTDSVENHKGQMAFPGGISEPEDAQDPSMTALRETEE